MSSSTEALTPRSRIVRHGSVVHAPVLQDLDALSAAVRHVIDPEAHAEALARGYEEGRAEGYTDGLAAGRAAAADEVARQHAEHAADVARAVDALRAAAAEVAQRRDETVAALEATLTAGAFELAEALLGRELELATSPGRDAVVRALRLADGTDPVVVRLNPGDIDALGEPASLAPGRDLTVVADPGVERGDCMLQVGGGRVDARLRTALDRVREVLAP